MHFINKHKNIYIFLRYYFLTSVKHSLFRFTHVETYIFWTLNRFLTKRFMYSIYNLLGIIASANFYQEVSYYSNIYSFSNSCFKIFIWKQNVLNVLRQQIIKLNKLHVEKLKCFNGKPRASEALGIIILLYFYIKFVELQPANLFLIIKKISFYNFSQTRGTEFLFRWTLWFGQCDTVEFPTRRHVCRQYTANNIWRLGFLASVQRSSLHR